MIQMPFSIHSEEVASLNFMKNFREYVGDAGIKKELNGFNF